MAFPSFNDLSSFLAAQADALQQFVAYVQGYLQVQHKGDGSHAAVTADSLTVTGAITGTTETLTGNAVLNGVTVGQQQDPASSIVSLVPSVTFKKFGFFDVGALEFYAADFVDGLSPSQHIPISLQISGGNAIFGNLSSRVSAAFGKYTGGETGAWTPVLSFGGASTGITYSTQTGTYSKFGNVVTAEMRIVLTSKGSSTGTAAISGLPYAAAGSPAALLDFGAGGVSLASTPYAAISSTSLFPLHISAGVRTQLTDANFSGTDDLRFGISYRV